MNNRSQEYGIVLDQYITDSLRLSPIPPIYSISPTSFIMTLKNYTESRKKVIDRDFRAVGRIFAWQKIFLTIGGLWPLESTYIRATIWIVYFLFQLGMEYAELLSVIGDLEAMVLSMVESSMQTMAFAKLITFRYSKVLQTIMITMMEEYKEEMFDDYEEKELYLKYNYLAKMYLKISIPYILTAATLYYFRPILTTFIVGSSSINDSLVLPFRTKIPFPILDASTYFMTYVYMAPMIYLLACHNAWQCLLITIQFHICGQLSVVEYRIKNIVSDGGDVDECRRIFESLVERHGRSVWMAKAFDDSFHFISMIDLVVMTLLLGLGSYVIILGSAMALIFVVAISATLFLMYVYCIIGEYLISESMKVHAAYYQCLWYESTKNFRSSLMICMMQSEKPLQMTAGKFFVFSLTGFTDILKTAMGYISMLRKVSQ